VIQPDAGAGFLQRTLLGNSVLEWLVALAVAIGAMAGLWLLERMVVRRLRTLAGRTSTDLDDLVTELLSKTKLLFVLLLGVWAGSLSLDLSPRVDGWIRRILIVGLLIQGALWCTALVNHFMERFRRREVELDPGTATAMGALAFVARAVVWSVFVLLILQNLGVQVTTLVGTLGIGGIAVALAVQNILGDLFASLSIVLDKPFVVGDFIIIGDFMGTVEHVGLKTTRLTSLGGEQLIFANSDLLNSRIRNYKRMQERRIVFEIGVTYDTPEEEVREIPEMIREAVEARSETRFDRSHFKRFGDSALIFETVYYMLVPDYAVYMDTQEAINLELLRRFREREIEFAFPTRTVHVEAGEASSRSFGPGPPPRTDAPT